MVLTDKLMRLHINDLTRLGTALLCDSESQEMSAQNSLSSPPNCETQVVELPLKLVTLSSQFRVSVTGGTGFVTAPSHLFGASIKLPAEEKHCLCVSQA